MLSGLPASTKPVSSSTSGSASTITPDRTRRQACVRPFRKFFIEVAHSEGLDTRTLLKVTTSHESPSVRCLSLASSHLTLTALSLLPPRWYFFG